MTEITFGELMRRYRLRAGLTQKQVAAAIHCDHSLVSRMERGDIFPSLEYVRQFVQAEVLALSDAERKELLEVYRRQTEARHRLTMDPPTMSPPIEPQAPQLEKLIPEGLQEKIRGKTRWDGRRLAVWAIMLTLFALTLAIASFTPWPQGSHAAEILPSLSSPPGHIVVAEPLFLSSTTPQIGQLVTVTLRIKNETDQTVRIFRLEAAVRGPGAQQQGWNAPQANFPAVVFLTLPPAADYTYVQTRTFSLPGDYFAEPVMMDSKGRWGGIRPFTRVWFTVKEKLVFTTRENFH